eukprot:7176080-Ditylum_brightwellii.AAC.1
MQPTIVMPPQEPPPATLSLMNYKDNNLHIGKHGKANRKQGKQGKTTARNAPWKSKECYRNYPG